MLRYMGLWVWVGVMWLVVWVRLGCVVMFWFFLMMYLFGLVVLFVIVLVFIFGFFCWKCGILDCECGVCK